MRSSSTLLDFANEGDKTNSSWGLTIYRTTYSTSSTTHFHHIIELLTALVKYGIRHWLERNPNQPAKLAAKAALQETYEPIMMSRKSEFNKMTMEGIRAHYKALLAPPSGAWPHNNTNKWFCVLVDDEVAEHLAGADPRALIAAGDKWQNHDKYWVKVIETDPEDKEDTGWMRCSVYSLFALYVDMNWERSMRNYEAHSPEGVFY
ncbi:hypothetical protein BDW59DRAFT_159890 [Aspergillus cavernicola]|uniref:Uncharacterized protein n=1 Tax=Aspergillus cavernicola TaxID=176166 RepID=A0ABR4IJK7_9EURO